MGNQINQEQIDNEDQIFWKDGLYEAESGIFIRNDLFKFFQKLKEAGKKPVAIRVHDNWNLEIFTQKIDE